MSLIFFFLYVIFYLRLCCCCCLPPQVGGASAAVWVCSSGGFIENRVYFPPMTLKKAWVYPAFELIQIWSGDRSESSMRTSSVGEWTRSWRIHPVTWSGSQSGLNQVYFLVSHNPVFGFFYFWCHKCDTDLKFSWIYVSHSISDLHRAIGPAHLLRLQPDCRKPNQGPFASAKVSILSLWVDGWVEWMYFLVEN